MVGNMIFKIRTEAGMTQAQLAELFSVSQQTVQKWENGHSTPELSKLIAISKHFDVSMDLLVLGNDQRVVEEMNKRKMLRPQYGNIHEWEFYASNLMTEYQQSVDEGLDIEGYREIFSSVSRLPAGEIKKRLGDVLFDVVLSAKTREGYRYAEPSDLESIKALRRGHERVYSCNREGFADKLYGAWLGRACGCMLGKTVEGIHTEELIPFLKETGNYPMKRYIRRSDLTDRICAAYQYGFAGRAYADEIDGMPVDDDTNYVVLAQKIVEVYGRDFTPYDVSRAWLEYQGKDAYCTAERVAFCNFVKGYAPPESAVYQNPYREWIGAQIRGDYFGYINPAKPELAAEMAWRDASISHVKNGIYGEMLAAAMISVAASTNCVREIVLGGLAQIPHTSRLYEDMMAVVDAYDNGVLQKDCFRMIHEKYDEHTSHGWCHTISNAMIVAAALLYGKGEFGTSVCMAVEAGFDTDCNGATVGSILGMANGEGAIGAEWRMPINDKIHTSIFGVGTVSISQCAEKTLAHVEW